MHLVTPITDGCSDVGDLKLVTKTVTNILNLSPTHFVSNIRHQQRSPFNTQNKFCNGIDIYLSNSSKINHMHADITEKGWSI